MDALLLAGGFGTRLRPLTYTRPKPLVSVAGRPMLEWVLDRLPRAVDRVVVAVNWRADELEAYFRARGGRLSCTVVREPEPLGTGGALKNAEEHLAAEDVLVLNADIVSDMDLDALVAAHRAAGAQATISLKEVPRPDVVSFGVVQPGERLPSGAVRVEGFVEKPRDPSLAPSRLVNAGAYLLDRRTVLRLIPPGRLVSLEKEIFPHLIPMGFWGLPFEGAWIDVGDPERLVRATRHLDDGYRWGPDSHVPRGARFTGSVAGSGLRVGAGAVVEGCVLGDGVTLAAGARLSRCVVGDGETVSGEHHDERVWTGPVPAGYPAQQVGNALEPARV